MSGNATMRDQSGPTQCPSLGRVLGVAFWLLGLAVAVPQALAQTSSACDESPDSGAATWPAPTLPTAGPDRLRSKFSLASHHCSGLMLPTERPAPERQAQQLGLYTQVSVDMFVPTSTEWPRTEAWTTVSQPAIEPTATPRRQAAQTVFRQPAMATAATAANPSPNRRVSASAVQRVRDLAPTVSQAARRHDIDPLLLHAVAHVESRHNIQALSPAGARGALQVMPATARRFGVADPHAQLHDPAINVGVAAEYLKLLQLRFGNNLPLVLAAYNAGEGAVEKYGRRIPPYPETQAYVRQVLDIYGQLQTRLRGAATEHRGIP